MVSIGEPEMSCKRIDKAISHVDAALNALDSAREALRSAEPGDIESLSNVMNRLVERDPRPQHFASTEY